jgi:ABC-2 type transport system ATP-binding protein
MTHTVVVEDVRKRFAKTQAVDGVSLAVAPGEIFGMLGPNGAGKTTTIRMILDIIRPDSGHITILDGQMSEEKKNRIGYLPEERGLYADIKLIDVIRYMASLKGMNRPAADAAAEKYLTRLDLWQHRDKKMSQLSRGMHQKAQFTVTVMHAPDLVIVDEPFAGLDPVNTELIRGILQELRDQGKTVIMSSHEMSQVQAMCDRIVLIHRGKVVLEGAVNEVRRRFAGNTVEVSGAGPIEQSPLIQHAERRDGAWRVNLVEGASPQQLLHEMVGRPDITVDHFTVALPHLHEIFIRIVGANHEQ